MTNDKADAYTRLRELTRDNVLDELHPALRPDIVAVLDELATLRKEIGDARTILASRRIAPPIPDDVCDACMGQGSHIQSGMACPHCAGSGARSRGFT
jgi:hypothetical protein